MAILDLYSNSEHRRNLAHFAAIASLAATDGEVNAEEKVLLDSFAVKLDITEQEYKEVMKKSNKYPIDPPISAEKRLERLYDFFRIIYVDHQIEREELSLVRKYAIGVGYSKDVADTVIQRSIAIFSGKIDFEDYKYLMKL